MTIFEKLRNELPLCTLKSCPHRQYPLKYSPPNTTSSFWLETIFVGGYVLITLCRSSTQCLSATFQIKGQSDSLNFRVSLTSTRTSRSFKKILRTRLSTLLPRGSRRRAPAVWFVGSMVVWECEESEPQGTLSRLR